MDTRADTSSDRPGAPPEPPATVLGEQAALGPIPAPIEWSGDDALSDFPTESDVRRGAAVQAPTRTRTKSKGPAWPVRPFWPVAGALAILVLSAAAWRWWPSRAAVPGATGTVAIETSPPGATVVVDGRERGATPLTLPLPAGAHKVALNGSTGQRELTVTVVAGTQVVHHIELARAVPTTGRLQVTGPAGGLIVLDGRRRGVVPAVLTDIPPGEHTVTVGDGAAAVTQRVTVTAGGLASLVVPAVHTRGQAPAWISVVAPVALQVFDGEALIGKSTTNRILVLAGRHTLNLVNEDLKYRTARTVDVDAGRVATVRVGVPNGVLNVNAVPWAEVLVDGKHVGETPIANLAIPIGTHEVTLRNPKFPEQKRSVVISLGGPTRLGVDLRQ